MSSDIRPNTRKTGGRRNLDDPLTPPLGRRDDSAAGVRAVDATDLASERLSGVLDRRSSVPLYYQLQEILHQQIASARVAVGDALPSEGELCKRFGVSRIVVRQALEVLEDDGEIIRMQGKGTFVAEPKLDLAAGGLVRVLVSPDRNVYDIEVLDAHYTAVEASVAQRLGASNVLRVDWLLRLRNEPLAIAYSFLRQGALPTLERAVLRGKRPTAGAILAPDVELDPVEISVSTSHCSTYNADRLGIPPRAPIFLVDVTELARADEHEPEAIEVARVIYRSDTLSLQLESTTGGGVHQISARISSVLPA
jgi:GntR family transcriptional regulator